MLNPYVDCCLDLELFQLSARRWTMGNVDVIKTEGNYVLVFIGSIAYIAGIMEAGSDCMGG